MQIENDILLQIQRRIQSLLFDKSITHYREYESFKSSSNRNYQFLIWKLQPTNWEQFSNEMRYLMEKKGYQAIPEAWDVTNYNPETKTGYKVVALYQPDES